MKLNQLFLLNILLIGGLTIPTCNKAKAADNPSISKINDLKHFKLPIDSNKNHHFKNYPQQ